MQTEHIQKTLASAKEQAPKRNFTQSVDIIFNLKSLDLKKTDNHVDFYAQLPYANGRNTKVCALVGAELYEEAKKTCDHAILADEFSKLTKKDVKKLAEEYHFFIAQANIMAQVAKNFGRVLGPRGKMPDPKAGCVVPPKTSLQPIIERLSKMIRISAKKDPVMHLMAGREDQDEAEVIENISYIYNQVIHHLPLEGNNVKNALLKLTMGKPVVLQ